jgi:hypothetical protein
MTSAVDIDRYGNSRANVQHAAPKFPYTVHQADPLPLPPQVIKTESLPVLREPLVDVPAGPSAGPSYAMEPAYVMEPASGDAKGCSDSMTAALVMGGLLSLAALLTKRGILPS